MISVGIPRALLYYQYYPMWKTFFEHLGAEVVVSHGTTQTTLSQGSGRVVADTCLPAKAFIGHAISLVDRCDYVFIPAVRSLKPRTYNCSKFLGLPDMTRAVVPESPPILDIEIDVNQGRRRLYQAIYGLGRHFTWNPLRIKQAAEAAWSVHQDYRKLMSDRGLTPPQAIDEVCGVPAPQSDRVCGAPAPQSDRLAGATDGARATIGVIGHAYLLYDEHTNYQLMDRLKRHNVRVVTPEMVRSQEFDAAVSRVVGRAYWTYEEDVVGAGGYYLEGGIDGIIGVMAFGCGPDSLMMDMVQRRASELRSTPFMNLTLEEHTSEIGVITRLEAFLDMIDRRKRSRTAVCA